MVLDQLAHPIVQAPLAGGPSTPSLAVAVSEAGALGFLAAGYRSGSEVAGDLAEVRERTAAPFGVNLFVPGRDRPDPAAVRAYLNRLRDEAARYGAEVGEPRGDDDDWTAKLELLLRERPAVASFTFGCPDPEVIAELRRAGVEVWVTVTDPAEADIAKRAGADVLVLQGIEAGGHRATFADRDDGEGLGILALLRLVGAGFEGPLVAAGAITDGAALAAVLCAGAAAAQLGSAFLRAREAGTVEAYRRALEGDASTALTRAFSGRQARGIRNRFLEEHSAFAPSAYPQVHHATSPLRAAARRSGDADGFNLWAGQAYPLARDLPAGEIVTSIGAEARAALAAAARRPRSQPT